MGRKAGTRVPAGAGERRRPVMMDVARLAGVSQTTVSLVLNDVEVRISSDAKARVQAAAAQLGYRLGPRGTGQMRTVAMLVDELTPSPLTAATIEGARDAAWEANALIVIASARGNPVMEAATLDLWHAQGIGSLIYARTFTVPVAPSLMLDSFDTVLVNCFDEAGRFPAVVPAEVRGGAHATRLLIKAGHRRVAFINGEGWMRAAQDRARGYRRALKEAGIELDPDLVRSGDWTITSGYESTFALMALPSPPTAIFCANDLMAEGCYAALKEQGRDIPDDVSVLGYDNRAVSQHLQPPLTTFELPHQEMGRWAVAHLLSGVPSRHGRVTLACPLVWRASVAAPRTARRPLLARA